MKTEAQVKKFAQGFTESGRHRSLESLAPSSIIDTRACLSLGICHLLCQEAILHPKYTPAAQLIWIELEKDISRGPTYGPPQTLDVKTSFFFKPFSSEDLESTQNKYQKYQKNHKYPLVLLFRPFLFIILPHLEMERWKLSQTQTLVKERPSPKNAVTLEQRQQVWGLCPPICPISFRVIMRTEFASFSSFKQSKCYLLIAGLWFSNCVLWDPRALQ